MIQKYTARKKTAFPTRFKNSSRDFNSKKIVLLIQMTSLRAFNELSKWVGCNKTYLSSTRLFMMP